METQDGGRLGVRALAVAAVALAGLAFSLTPLSQRLDNALLDLGWSVLARLDPRPAPEDIVIVGIDEASARAIAEPPGMWHAPLGAALARLAAARPRAILLDVPLPERSYDGVKPGVDRALFDGLATALEAGPFVAALNIDARTRAAREIHKPYLALLGESRLGLGLIARDGDGVARRYSLLVPTEDGGFPTVVGRLCRAVKAECAEGLIHFSLGQPFSYVPLRKLLEMRDESLARSLFRDRIVLIGSTHPFSGRVDAPVNLAVWEEQARDTPAIVLQAQTLRSALSRAAPREASRPVVVLLVSLSALLVLARDWRRAGVSALALALFGAPAAVAALRSGLFVPLGAVSLTLVFAVALRAVASTGGIRTPA
jgi:CHASE2 domain-containing sensor protein